MRTVKEIERLLQTETKPTSWIESLREDSRVGVQKALARWERSYEKKEYIKAQHQKKIAFDSSFAPFQGAYVAGVDEAGRGPLAGPVVTAVVILPIETPELIGLDDSKMISKEKREELALIIKDLAIDYSVHIQSASKVDELNIYAATLDSMERAVNELSVRPDFVIVDAMKLNIESPTVSVIKADEQSLAVAAASILAKTTRDQLMDDIHQQYPQYNFQRNAGYGTPEHLDALRTHGPCAHHRKSFEPIKSIIAIGRTDT